MKHVVGFAVGAVLLSAAAWQGPAENDFHFSIVGDRSGSPEPQVYGRVMREVALLRPDFAVTVGDAIEGNQDETLEAEWKHIESIWAQYPGLKLFHVPGNHDIWNEKSREAFQKHTGFATHYSFRRQNALFVVADTGRGEELPEAELDFIEQELTANPAAAPKLVFFHKPFWLDRLQAGDTSFRLHAMMRKHGVSTVVSGHGHRFAHILRNGVHYMEVGSSGGSMRGKLVRGEGFKEGCFYHHVWARVKGAQVFFTVREIDGMYGHGRMFDAFEWDEKGPKFPADDPALAKTPPT